jgi:hypothetical protein
MKQTEVRQLVLDVVRKVARGRPVASGTEFSRIGIGPWQRQRFFGPLRDAFHRRGLDITGGGVTRESFTHYRTLREVQAAIWNNLRAGRPRPGPRRDSDSALPPFEWDRATMP